MSDHVGSGGKASEGAGAFAYLDTLLGSEIDARLIALGFGLGWFSGADGPPPGFDQLAPNAQRLAHARLSALGLWDAAVPGRPGSDHATFAALRDLVEARLWFLTEIAPDFSAHFELFLGDGSALVQRARLFQLFDYSAALGDDVAAQERTARWLRYTSVLSRYEGPELARRMQLSGTDRLLDIGGNSGAFALALAAAYPALEIDIFDLPAVCAIGRQHVAGQAGSERIRFLPGDFRADALPTTGQMSFKSILHDWPDDVVRLLLGRVAAALPPGGRLHIVEREAPDMAAGAPGFSQLANFAFLPFYRTPEHYAALLADAGFVPQRVERFVLDGPFLHIVATREG